MNFVILFGLLKGVIWYFVGYQENFINQFLFVVYVVDEDN